MWHVAVDLLYGRIFFIPLLFLFGFLLERIAPAGEMRSNRDFLLNCVCGFFFISFDLMASLLVASLLVGQHGRRDGEETNRIHALKLHFKFTFPRRLRREERNALYGCAIHPRLMARR